MHTTLLWYTARAAGIVTWALLAASVLWGLALSTRVLFVSHGQIMADGTPDEVFSDERLAEVFLGLA